MIASQEEVRDAQPADSSASAGDGGIITALRAGNEDAFMRLVEQYHSPMLRVAMMYVSSRAVAEEVVQETWMGVLQGIARFAGRSSLKTWIFRILINRAKTRGEREGRCVPFSALWDPGDEAAEPAVDAARFFPSDHPRLAGHWVVAPSSWAELPEERFLSGEIRAALLQAVEALPPGQRMVIALRDIEGWAAAEVCVLLGISEANQRVLLHRARARVRRALEQYLAEA